jgi:hypothetical protein
MSKKLFSLFLTFLLCFSFCEAGYNKPPLGSQINWSNPLTKGLVRCWLMNERSGQIYDLCRQQIAIFSGSPTWKPGKYGSALYFDDVDDSADITNYLKIFATTGTWTCPAGVTSVTVEAWGGGGGGGGGGAAACGYGGGGGAYSKTNAISVTPGNNYTVTVGIAGTAGASTPTDGGTGGDSGFSDNSQILAKGGSGGQYGGGSIGVGIGGASASGVGDIKTSGGNGGTGYAGSVYAGGGGGSGGDTTSGGNGGNGTASVNGALGAAGTTNGAKGGAGSAAGSSPGGAGGGGNATFVGYAGAVGRVRISLYPPKTIQLPFTNYPFTIVFSGVRQSGSYSNWYGVHQTGLNLQRAAVYVSNTGLLTGVVYTGSTGGASQSVTVISTGQEFWGAYVGYSSTNRSMFCNGVFESNSTTSKIFPANPDTESFARFWGGMDPAYYLAKFNFVYVYNRALTNAEISRLYQEPFCIFKKPSLWKSVMRRIIMIQ